MSLPTVQKLEADSLVHTYERLPVLMERGKGVHLYDADGKKYLDFLSGIGVNALGYAHPAIHRAITEQSKKLLHVSNLFFHEYQSELATRLSNISGLDRAFFCNSGTEAWEGALKFARAYARSRNSNGSVKWRILAMSNSFHGRTFGSLATTGQAKYRKPFAPVMPGVRFVRFNDTEDLKRKFDSSICAIAMEVIQGEGGIHAANAEFLHAARQLTSKSGAVLIFDEIQSGLGRTGEYFAYQHYGIKPDIVTVAKPLAAGLPLGAILVTNQVAAAIKPGMHGTTFGGGPLACAVAIEFLRTLEREQLLKKIAVVGEFFKQELRFLAGTHPCIVDVRGVGLMVAAELDSAELAKHTVSAMLDRGVIINRTHETVLRFLPPYTIGKKEINALIHALDGVLREGPVNRNSKVRRKRIGNQS